MTFFQSPGAAFRFPTSAVVAALARLNQRTQAATRLRLERSRSVSSAIAAQQAALLSKYLEFLKVHHPALHADLLALQAQAKNPILSASWKQAVASFQARHSSTFVDLRGMFPDTRPYYLSQFFIPPTRYARGQPPDSAPSSPAPSLAQKTVSLRPFSWFGIEVGDPPYEDGENLIDCELPAGTSHIKTHTRVAIDTFGLTNTGGCGVFVDVDRGYRQVEISVECDYSGVVTNSTPLGEASSSVDMIYDVTDLGTGDSVDHFEYTIRAIVDFPPSSFGQSDDFSSSGQLMTSTLSIAPQRSATGISYVVSIQYRCTAQAFGGAVGNAFVLGTLNRVDVTMIP